MSGRSSVSITRIPAGFARWDEVLALILEAFAFMDGVIDPPSSAHRLSVDTLRMKADRETGFLALDKGRIVGCLFALERADDFYVGKLAVAPDRHGRGIGRKLMRAAEVLASGRGKPALELETRIELVTNHATFARLGFQETGRTAHEGYDKPTSITMRKSIS
ncbi:GNAT family N-acetyltransferase [Mesorhizobium comanense]|uniref:GNAT family N-acetyltransferase n=1 Tax=Mesorhizobium comanense TaxID=2502215 RepID=UPI0010F5F2D7|nr:GNAT family N-acetyltransferase [Mesorhizobium comanense]